jgi:hypothetical protein
VIEQDRNVGWDDAATPTIGKWLFVVELAASSHPTNSRPSHPPAKFRQFQASGVIEARESLRAIGASVIVGRL